MKVFTALSGTFIAFICLADAAQVYYDFESISGNTVPNEAMPTPNGTLVGNPATISGPNGGTALDLDGSDDSVVVNNTSIINSAPGVSLAAWVRPDAIPSSIGSIIFISNGQFHYNSRAGIFLNSNGEIEVAGRSLDSDGFQYRTSVATLNLGEWVHVAGVVDYVNEVIKIFINSEEQVLQSGSVSFGASQSDSTDSLAFTVGSTDQGFEFFNGGVDDVYVFREALSDSEIAALVPELSNSSLIVGLLFLGLVSGFRFYSRNRI